MDRVTLPCLKGRYPLRVCAPSYLFPAGYGENVRRLRSAVDEVELLFLESGALPSAGEIAELRNLAVADSLRFNVHLPVDLDVCSTEGGLREHARQVIGRLVRLAAPLAPTALLLHLHGPAGRQDAGWRSRLRDSLARLPEPRAQFAVETLAWDLGDVADLLRELGFSVCIDVGHLAAAGRDLQASFEAFRGSISMIHLHGVRGGRDHLPLTEMPSEARARLRRILEAEGYRGTVCLEVFSAEGFLESLPALEEIMPC